MRLILKIGRNSTLVPFDYQRSLVGAFHRWLGENKEHDELSLYSFSWLQGGKSTKDGIDFKQGAEWHISSFDTLLIKRILKGLQEAPTINYGMRVEEVAIIETPEFGDKQKFYLDSPIFIKRKQENKVKHFTYTEADSDFLMTETLQFKLTEAGLNSSGVKVSFDRTYQNAKTKKITYNGIGCRASMCPVIVEGSPEQIAFAWNVGIGSSTGIGFGALK